MPKRLTDTDPSLPPHELMRICQHGVMRQFERPARTRGWVLCIDPHTRLIPPDQAEELTDHRAASLLVLLEHPTEDFGEVEAFSQGIRRYATSLGARDIGIEPTFLKRLYEDLPPDKRAQIQDIYGMIFFFAGQATPPVSIT